jgi:molecular chaperone GrpE
MNKKKSKLSEFIEEIKNEVSAEANGNGSAKAAIKPDKSESAQASEEKKKTEETDKDKIVINIKDLKKDAAQEKTISDKNHDNDHDADSAAALIDAVVQKKSAADGALPATEDITSEQAQETVTNLIDTLTAERDDLKDKYLRKAAELENYIKRSRKEKDELRDLVTAEFILKLLSVTDNFERALSIKNSSAEQLLEGLKLTHQQLFDILKEYGLYAIPNMSGKIFDPQIHEAIFIEPSDKYPANTIIQEYLKGYLYKDFTLRPSKVRVAVAMPETKESTESEMQSATENLSSDEEDKEDSEKPEHDNPENGQSSQEENN